MAFSSLEVCAECKRNCLLCHQKTRSSTPIVSSFFKVMITDWFSEVLFLPPKFAPVASSMIGQEVPLEDSSGLQWKVKLILMENSVALNQGWDVFAQAHGLEIGDFVIFHYVLGSHFVVQIFDKTGCEKLDFSKNKNQKKRANADTNSTQGCGPCHVADKGPTDKPESKSSVFNSSMETSHQQGETRNMKNIKTAMNGSSSDKKGVARSQAVPKAGIFEDPCSLMTESKCKINDPVNVEMAMNGSSRDRRGVARSQAVSKAGIVEDPCSLIKRESKRKINDSVNIKMCTDTGLKSKNRIPRPQAVPKAKVFDRELDGKDAEYQTANQDTLRTYNLDTLGSNKTIGAKVSSHNVDTSRYSKNQAGSDYKASQKVAPVGVSNFDSSVFGRWQTDCDEGREKANSINTGKKPKVKREPEDPILSSPVGYKDKAVKKVKVEAINKHSLSSAGSITCLIEANESFLELPAALPSSYKGRKRGSSSRSVVFLRGPKMKVWPVSYHETSQRKILMGGWEAFCQYNNILAGDECTFEIENEAEDVFLVTVVTPL
ncbi:uncharacterized protein [Euphorbia lathyris]|uniref:uncharacterized protein n=1 Tax=Euphorbia lathyris TaxID=212925 RepID=UPI003313862A